MKAANEVRQRVVIVGSALETWIGHAVGIAEFVDSLLAGRLIEQRSLGMLDMTPLKPGEDAAAILASPHFSGRYAWRCTAWLFADGVMVIAGLRDVIAADGQPQRQAQFTVVDREASLLLPVKPRPKARS